MRPIGICNGSLTFPFEKAAVGQNDCSLIAGVTRTIRFISSKENIKTFLGYAVWNLNAPGGGGALQLRLYRGARVWPQDRKIDPSAD